jgi:hypothetical protein
MAERSRKLVMQVTGTKFPEMQAVVIGREWRCDAGPRKRYCERVEDGSLDRGVALDSSC